MRGIMIMMFKQILKNKKGTAEVVGSVMFIIILLFFFTNVYLWHDAATKEMNDLQVQKINSQIDVSVSPVSTTQYDITVTDTGGVDAKLSIIWVIEKSALSNQNQNPVLNHKAFDDSSVKDVVIPAGGNTESKTIHLTLNFNPTSGNTLIFKVYTAMGNFDLVSYRVP
jgi:hypothetical protein